MKRLEPLLVPLRSQAFRLVVLTLGLLFSILYAIGAYLIVDDGFFYADAMIPLAGEPIRPIYAGEVFLAEYAPVVLITHLPVPNPRARANYIRDTQGHARNAGVPDEAMQLVPGVGLSTYGEAFNVLAHAQEQGFRSLLIITSPYHTRRSKRMYEDAFLGSGIRIGVIPVRPHPYRPHSWFLSRHNLRNTFAEYLKLTAYSLGIR